MQFLVVLRDERTLNLLRGCIATVDLLANHFAKDLEGQIFSGFKAGLTSLISRLEAKKGGGFNRHAMRVNGVIARSEGLMETNDTKANGCSAVLRGTLRKAPNRRTQRVPFIVLACLLPAAGSPSARREF